MLVKLLRGQAELFRLETPTLPLGCHKANNNSKPCYSPILREEKCPHATKTAATLPVTASFPRKYGVTAVFEFLNTQQ